jgi:superfamily II DNA or RNA helicase
LEKISPYIHKDFYYKINETPRTSYKWNSKFTNISYAFVKKVEEFCSEEREYNYVYDIEVEDNHNYIVGFMGGIIVHNCHTIATKRLSESLGFVAPRYLIGLSATPTRPDGMDVLLDVYFGKQRINRELHRKHIVYKVNTGFVPTVQRQRSGKVDWNSVLESQAHCAERNNLIVRIVKHFRERYFLILCKRVAQGNWLIQRLKEEGEDVTSLIGKQTEFDFNSRILVATIQKCGFGFDHPKLNTLLMAGDAEEYYVQFLGRVFRSEEGVPWVFELVDDFGILQKHYQTRRKVYLKAGGIIKDFNKCFPTFS